MRQLSFILSSKSILSDGKDNNEQSTRVSLPCVKGGGPRSGGRIVIEHKLTFTPFKSFLSDGKAKNECGTRVSLHLLEGGGTVRQGRMVEGVNTARKHTLTPLRSFLSDSKTKK